MIDRIFPHQSFKNSITEMRSIITNYRSGGAKLGEDVFFEKYDNHFVVIGLCRHSFYPFRDIVYSNQNELVAEGIREWSHEVDTPNIKISTSRIRFRGIISLLKILPIF